MVNTIQQPIKRDPNPNKRKHQYVKNKINQL